MSSLPDLCRLAVDEVGRLRRACEEHLSAWFAFSKEGQAAQTPEFRAATAWRLEGQSEPCCECGGSYPRADLHFRGELYCPECREEKKEGQRSEER